MWSDLLLEDEIDEGIAGAAGKMDGRPGGITSRNVMSVPLLLFCGEL
jgi:hypothetical protein